MKVVSKLISHPAPCCHDPLIVYEKICSLFGTLHCCSLIGNWEIALNVLVVALPFTRRDILIILLF